VWSVPRLHRQDAEREDHPTQKPLAIVERMLLASSPPGGLVLDPFVGSGTTAVAAAVHERRLIGFELNADYLAIARGRVAAALGSPSPAAQTGRKAADEFRLI
jgi:site-specific DNA-methyltransferase (adenine-specific)